MVVIPRRRDDSSLAYALLRVTLGLNIFMHGTSRLLAGIGNFVSGMIKRFKAPCFRRPLLCYLRIRFALAGSGGSAFSLSLAFVPERLWSPVPFLMLALDLRDCASSGLGCCWVQLLYSAVYAALIAALRYNSLSVDHKAFAAVDRE